MLARLSLIAVLLAVAVTAQPPTADARPGKRQGLTFQDVRPLKLSWTEARTGDGVPARVCNLDRRTATEIEARVTAVGKDDGNDVVTGWSDPWQPPDSDRVLAPGKCTDLFVKATGDRPDNGTYTGILVATSAGSGGARRKVALRVGGTAPAGAPDPKLVDPWRILPDTVSDFSVGAVNFVPSLLNPFDTAALNFAVLLAAVLLPFLFLGPLALRLMLAGVGTAVVLVLISGWGDDALDPPDAYFEGSGPSAVHVASPGVESTPSSGAVGSLVGKDGFVAMAVVENGQLDVKGLPRAGAYSGKIDLLADADGGDATMTANVRDWWPYALLPVAAGVLLGAWLTRYFTVLRPRAVVRQKKRKLREKVGAESDTFRREHLELYEKYKVEGRMEKRFAAIDELIESPDAEERKKANTAVSDADTYFENVRLLWAHLVRLAAAANDVERLVDQLDLGLAGKDVPSVVQARDLLSEPLDPADADTDSSDLTDRATRIDTVLKLVEAQVRALPRAAELRDEVNAVKPDAGWTQEDKDALVTHKTELSKGLDDLTIKATTDDDVRKALAAVSSAASDIRDLPKRPPPALARAVADAALVFPEEHLLELALLGPDEPLLVDMEAATPTEPGSAEQARRFMVTDRQVTALAGVLAVLSGLLTLYVPSATWGTPGDYLKAFLWGSVLSEGIKYVTSLVGKVAFNP